MSIVGTWLVEVPPADGFRGFKAVHSYSEGGTLVETSDLLGELFEGPAHGVWEGKKRDYSVTFHVFEFDPDGNPIGRVRVRCAIRLIDEDHLTANTKVDFIEPDGTIIPEIGASPFTATRIKVVPY